jgi:ABC-type multidrug transport system ATPase subunit
MVEKSDGTLFLKPTQLIVIWPDGRRERLTLTKPVTTIGRSEDSDLPIPVSFTSISRKHLQITREGAEFSIQDLGSTNGVWVNAVRVENALLSDKDIIRIGLAESGEELTIEFQLGTESLFLRASVADAGPTDDDLIKAAPQEIPHLQIRWPTGETNYFPIIKPHITVGRSPQADLETPSGLGFISAQHFELRQDAQGFTITDLNSTNGTLLNNQPLPPNTPVNLPHDSIIRIGDDNLGISISFTFSNPAGYTPQVSGFVAAAPAMTMQVYKPIIIGRLPENDIHLDAPDISRSHAEIRQDGEQYFIRDLNSRNGTYINGKRVTTAEIFEGDLIQIGSFLLTFQDGEVTPYQSSGMRVDVSDLSKTISDRRGTFRIIDEINMSVLPREFIAIVGGSGAGKTTLLNALVGIRPGEGQVQLNGHDFYQEYEHFRAQLGYVPQNDILHTSLTVNKALDYTARMRLPASVSKEEREKRISAVLETVNMNSDKTRQNRVSRLSGGQRKRISIASELIADPKLIYLDEATSGLDPGLEKKMMHTLRRMADEGRTVVLITHATNNIVQTDHVAFISQGKLVFFGPSPEALEFFEVDDFADIYGRIDKKGDEWRNVYENDKPENHERYVAARKENALAMPERELPKIRFGLGDLLRQFWVLTQRAFSVLFSDPVSLALMLLLLPLTGTLQLVIGSREILTGDPGILANPVEAAKTLTESYIPFAKMNTFIFVMGLEAVLTGLFVPSNDLVKERSIYLRERMVNLKVLPYLLSKAAIYSIFVVIQVVLYLLILSLGVDFPEQGLLFNGTVELFITLFLTMMAGITFGFIISAVSRSTEMAIYILTMMLFFQFFFAGTVFDLRGNTFEPLSYLTTTRWSLTALGVTVDIPEIVEATVLCSDLPENPLDPNSALKTVCAHYPDAVDDLMLDYSDDMLLISWGVLAGMSVLFLVLTGILLERTRAY